MSGGMEIYNKALVKSFISKLYNKLYYKPPVITTEAKVFVLVRG